MTNRSAPSQNRNPRRWWFFSAKLAFTTIVLAYLFSQIELDQSVEAIGRAFNLWLVLGVLVMGLGLVVSAYKWDLLLRALGIVESKWILLEVYIVGFFVSRILPGIVGGDLVRWEIVGRSTGRRLKVAATILVERVTGFFALVCLCPLMVLITVPQLATPPVIALIGGMALAMIGFLLMALNRRVATSVMFRYRRLRIRKIFRLVYELHRTLRTFPRGPLLVALGLSVLFYLTIGAGFYFICKSFGAQISVVEAVSVQWLTSLLIAIPISLGGLGLAQAGDVYLLGILGISSPYALGVSLMRHLVNYGYAAIGGLLFIRSNAFSTRSHAPDRTSQVRPSGDGRDDRRPEIESSHKTVVANTGGGRQAQAHDSLQG